MLRYVVASVPTRATRKPLIPCMSSASSVVQKPSSTSSEVVRQASDGVADDSSESTTTTASSPEKPAARSVATSDHLKTFFKNRSKPSASVTNDLYARTNRIQQQQQTPNTDSSLRSTTSWRDTLNRIGKEHKEKAERENRQHQQYEKRNNPRPGQYHYHQQQTSQNQYNNQRRQPQFHQQSAVQQGHFHQNKEQSPSSWKGNTSQPQWQQQPQRNRSWKDNIRRRDQQQHQWSQPLNMASSNNQHQSFAQNLQPPTTNQSSLAPKDDGKDVSKLRQAFLKSFKDHRMNTSDKENTSNRVLSSQQQLRSSDYYNSSWRNQSQSYYDNNNRRNPAAKEFRKNQQHHMRQQEWQQRRNQNYQDFLKRKETHAKMNASFSKTAEDYIEEERGEVAARQRQKEARKRKQQQDRKNEKRIIELEFIEPMSIADFASRLRIKEQSVIKTLQDLGELSRRDNDETVDKYRIRDIDMMELIVLEMGVGEPVRVRRSRKQQETDNIINADDRNLLLNRRAASEVAGDLSSEDGEAKSSSSSHYESLPKRPPVVCIMGHVDHGKTTLMDTLRRRSDEEQQKASGKKSTKKKSKKSKKFIAKTSNKNGAVGDVAGTEAGGITQVITAFQVSSLFDSSAEDDKEKTPAVTFLDTPGHAAFKSMRESGSHAADVIVLVVAADDGVSPQTVEIINFYKSIITDSGSSNSISLVVAMNKIDKPGIDVEECTRKIENQLLEHGIVTESMEISDGYEEQVGPPVQLIPVSGLTGLGLDDLIEGLVLQSEIMDLRANDETRGEGIVMDARMEKGLGVVADCIIRWGSMKRGDIILSGTSEGKIKILKDFNNATLQKGIPSQPVRIIGFESLPKAGTPIICVESETMAERFIEQRKKIEEAKRNSDASSSTANAEIQITGTAAKNSRMTEMAERRFGIDNDDNNDDQKTIRVPVIIKADADGTLAAVRDSLLEVGSESEKYNIIIEPVEESIGPVLSSDVAMANQSNATIFTFNLKGLNDRTILNLAEKEGIQIRNHDVIYSLLDDAKDMITQRYIPPTPVVHVHGSATVQAIFDITLENKSTERIAGLRVDSGSLHKDKALVDWSESGNSNDGKETKHRADCYYRIIRNGKQIIPPLLQSSDNSSLDSSGNITIRSSSLKRLKEDVTTVRQGDECGLGLSSTSNELKSIDFQEGDVIECYSVELKRTFV